MLSRVALISLHANPLELAGQNNAGGLNVYVRALATALSARDLQVDVFTRRVEGETPDVLDLAPGARVIQIDAGPLEALPPDELLPFVPLFTAGVVGVAGVRGQPYDVVHSHYWLSGLTALRLRRRWNVPAAHMFHTLAQIKRRVARIWGPADQRRALLEQQVIDGVDAIVAANVVEATQLRNLYDAAHARIHSIPCGVDLGAFAPGDRAVARARLGLPADAPIVFTAARIEPLKDLSTAVRAISLLPRYGIDGTHLVVAGGPVTGPAGVHEVERLRAAARAGGMAERLHLVGAIPRDLLPLYMDAADVAVVPSLYESFGMVALEALACGVPVVASATGGLQLTVHDGENGYLVPAGHAPAFAERLADLLRNPVLARRMALAARRSAEPYGWTSVADRVACLYDSLAQTHARAAARPTAAG